MYCVRKVTNDLYWVGANDHRLALFENCFPIPRGVSYNAYCLLDEKTVLFDTVDWSACRQLLENLAYVLDGRELDYLLVNHLEPDHAACIEEILLRHPKVKLISNEKAFMLMRQFGFHVDGHECIEVKEGDTFSFGKHTVTFVGAPMVHWPEAMVTLDVTDGVLFSADAFGTFGALDGKLFAHAGSFHVTAEKIESMVSATNSLKGTVEQHTSAISQTASRIDQFVQKITFDSKGNITNIDKAGLVTESNIATMFAEKVDPNGDIVRRAQISAFITEGEAGRLISNATIEADRINFTGKTIINGSFVVDTNGRVTMNDITANNLTLKGSITGTDATLNGITANNLTLKGNISGIDAILNDITANNLTLKGNITGAGATLNDITANNLTLKGSITGRDAVLNDITANNLTLKGTISGANATLNDITANNLTLKGNISGANAILNGITVNGKINASSGRIGDYLYLHGNGISTNSRAFVTDLTDSTTQFELSKSYYLHAIASDGGANSILIRPYQTMEAGTVKGVVTISATIPGRNRAIHVSSGESYFGGDVIVGKMYAPSSGTLEIAGPLKTQGVYRNTDVILSSVTRYSIKATDHTLLFYGNCTISLPSSSDGHEIWIMPNGNTISFPSGTFANSSRTNINGREWHVIKRVLGNWYLSWMSI